jgi:Cysteine-rich secretory protein family
MPAVNTIPPRSSEAGSAPPAAATPPPESGSSPAPDSDDEFDGLRQACVDRINMYRATMSLPALERETPEIEACSDLGAKQDADSNRPHSSSGMCFEPPIYFGGGQNTCPSLSVGGFGNATLESSLIRCIDQMWAEGPPPAPTTVEQCIDDYTGCFPRHGHWINMIQTMYKSVSCGFYRKPDGSYWGNQDFPIQR